MSKGIRGKGAAGGWGIAVYSGRGSSPAASLCGGFPRRSRCAAGSSGEGTDCLATDEGWKIGANIASSSCGGKPFSLSGMLRGIPILGRLVVTRREIAEGAEAVLAGAGLGDFEQILGFPGGTPLTSHADRGSVVVEAPAGFGRERLYVKRLGRARTKHIFEALLAREKPISKCRREWEFAGVLGRIGVGAMPVLAYGERRFLFWPLESFVIAREIPGSMRLDAFLKELSASGEAKSRREMRAFAPALADTIARMHAAGLFHKDLYAKHIFVRREGGGFAINIIDLQRMTRGGGRAAVVRDLAALNVSVPWSDASRADRMRFLSAYAARRWPGGLRRERKLAGRILARSARISRRGKLKGVEWSRQRTA